MTSSVLIIGFDSIAAIAPLISLPEIYLTQISNSIDRRSQNVNEALKLMLYLYYAPAPAK